MPAEIWFREDDGKAMDLLGHVCNPGEVALIKQRIAEMLADIGAGRSKPVVAIAVAEELRLANILIGRGPGVEVGQQFASAAEASACIGLKSNGVARALHIARNQVPPKTSAEVRGITWRYLADEVD